MKRALITGITGQDGSHLAELLLSLGYRVTGLARGPARFLAPDIVRQIEWAHGDIRDQIAVDVAIHKAQPDEIYNLAGQTFVPPSWTNAEATMDLNVGGLTRILRTVEKYYPQARVYQASSSEMFGGAAGYLNEQSPMKPKSPYGVSKYAAHNMARIYREKGLFVCSGILFNHEGPRRGMEFVTRKISHTVALWASGERVPLKLGNMQARRDWGYAGDYVMAMYAMLQHSEPDDYVIGTGTAHSIYEFLQMAVASCGLKWEQYIELLQIDQALVRPNEVGNLCADYSKAKRVLEWQPSTSFPKLVEMMVNADIDRIAQNQLESSAQ